MTPEFERALNEAVARLCGKSGQWVARTQYVQQWEALPIPSYATDRNTLPEVIKAVECAGAAWAWISQLTCLVDPDFKYVEEGRAFALKASETYQDCIAALKACNAWTEELEELWQKEQGK